MPTQVKISPLPYSPPDSEDLAAMSQQVQSIFQEFTVSEVKMFSEEHDNICYAIITFQDDVLDALEFKYENKIIPDLFNAEIKEYNQT